MKPKSLKERTRETMTELSLEVFRLNGALLALGDDLVEDLGLTSARWQVLGAIAQSPVPLPVAHLARNMGLTRQSVQRLVGEMSTDGLLVLAPNPHHRRAQLVLFTERGKAAWDGSMSRWGPRAMVLGKELPPESIEAAIELLRSVRLRIEKDSASSG